MNQTLGLSEGGDEHSVSKLFDCIEQLRQDAEFETYPLWNIPGLFRLSREERWTSFCYEVRWIFGFGKESSNERRTRVVSAQGRRLLETRTLFIRQMICKEHPGFDSSPFSDSKPIWSWGWSVMQRDLSSSSATRSVDRFEAWLKDNYPGIRIPVQDLARTKAVGSVHIISGMFLLALSLAILYPLTLFTYDHQRKASAALFCVWLLAFPILRWTRLGHRADVYAYISGRELCWRGSTALLFFITSYFVIQGFLVTCVGLFESFCGLPSDKVPWAAVTIVFWYTSSILTIFVWFLFAIIRKSTTQFGANDLKGGIGRGCSMIAAVASRAMRWPRYRKDLDAEYTENIEMLGLINDAGN